MCENSFKNHAKKPLSGDLEARTRYYAHAIDPEGHVVTEFDTRLYLYSSPDDLADLIELCKEDHREYQYLTHEIVTFGGGTLYRWKRRVHPQEDTIPLEQVAEFYDWLREHAENGVEPGTYDHKAYLAEIKERQRTSPEDHSRPF
jgi:hypothetical protein